MKIKKLRKILLRILWITLIAVGIILVYSWQYVQKREKAIEEAGNFNREAVVQVSQDTEHTIKSDTKAEKIKSGTENQEDAKAEKIESGTENQEDAKAEKIESGTENKEDIKTEEIEAKTAKQTDIETKETAQTAAQTPEKTAVNKVKLTFTGDLMVHDYQYKAAYNSKTGKYDFSNNFTYVKKYLESADYTIGNFETTLAGSNQGISGYPRFNSPDSFAEAVKDAGYDLLTTANNHCADKGIDGLKRTIDVLNDLGFDQIGTYKSKKKSQKIFVKKINGIKIAFLSCTYGTNGLSFGESYHVHLLNKDTYKNIKRARKKADYVIVLPHNGTEYQTSPSEQYQKQYHKMLEAGADAVIASHPHVLQPMEYQTIKEKDGSRRTGFIIYSMGNFISSQVTEPRDAGVILSLTLEQTGNERAELKKVTVIPTWCRFTDAAGKRNFTVFSIYDLLHMKEKKRNSLLRAKDYARVQKYQEQSTKTLLRKAVSIEKSEKKYTFSK